MSVIDAEGRKLVQKISFETPGLRPELIQPVGIRFSKDGKLGFVALGPANRVAVVETETLKVKDYILVGQRSWHIEMAPDGGKLYVANGLTNDMTVIDVATLKAEQSVPVGACLGASPSSRNPKGEVPTKEMQVATRARQDIASV